MVLWVCVVLVCLVFFSYVGYPLVCLNMFACDEVCLSTFLKKVFACFCMLCSLLDELTHHIWVYLSKSTLLSFI